MSVKLHPTLPYQAMPTIHVQAFVVQVGARECVYAIDSSDGDSIRLQHIIQRSGMLLTEAKKSAFHTK